MLYFEDTKGLPDTTLGFLGDFVRSIVGEIERIESSFASGLLNWSGGFPLYCIEHVNSQRHERRVSERELTGSGGILYFEQHFGVVEIEVEFSEILVGLVGVPDDALEPITTLEFGIPRCEKLTRFRPAQR